MDEWTKKVIEAVALRLQKGEKLQLEYDGQGNLKLLEIKTKVVLKK
jgi:hypothetical protein